MWETHSTPEMGDRPQAIINKQIVTSCDFLIGAFWTRIGTHTGVAESGTVEEIEELIKAGKPVLLYFSSAPVVPDSINPEQYKRLTDFKKKCKEDGLIENYDSVSDLREKLNRHLTSTVRKIHGEPSFPATSMDEELRSVNAVKEQLRDLITHAEVDWKTERDSQPVSIDNGKNILEALASNLIDFRANLEDIVDQPVLRSLETQISILKKLRNHKVYIDGGISYKAFWQSGDEVFTALKGNTSEITYKEAHDLKSDSVGGLEKEKIEILKLLAKKEEIGSEGVMDSDISLSTGLSLVVTRYHLNPLEGQSYIYASYAVGQSILYSIDQKGRDFLIKNGLI